MRRSLLLTLGLALAGLGAACSSDSPPAATTSTTVAPTTTTTAATTTTPGQATTTTSSTPGQATTTPGVESTALRGDGLGVTAFGDAPDPAVAAVSATLGAPSDDTGWESSESAYGTCPGPEIRAVTWGGLVLLFTTGETVHGRGEHLFSWLVTGAPPALGTVKGLGFGATAADAEELYPGQVERVPAEEPFPGFLRMDIDGGTITAFLDEADAITNLEAGVACAE